MEFKFLGYGDAFNTQCKNTSCYFKEDNNLFLIDCGETVFSSLVKNNVLDGIKNMYIFITHTHADHIGSIGTLIMYNYFKRHIKTHIILSRDEKHKDNIDLIVHAFGCLDNMFDYIYEEELDSQFSKFDKIRYLRTTHYETLPCYSILFEYDKLVTFYSGDTNELETLKRIINDFEIDHIFIDTTSASYEGNVHMNVDILNENIPDFLREKVYCMHVNDEECIKLIYKYGFRMVGDI